MSARGRRSYRPGMRAGLAFVPGVFVLSASFGVTAAPVIGAAATVAMSILVFAGSAQFGATAVLAAGGGAPTAIATGMMLNARFLPMGIAAAPALRGSRMRRAAEGQTIVDTSWALAARGEMGFDREAMLGATLVQYPAWVLGTIAGVLFGEALGDPESLGLDAIFPAFFLALLVPELRRHRAVAAIAIGGALAACLTPLLPPGLPVLLASAGALAGLKR